MTLEYYEFMKEMLPPDNDYLWIAFAGNSILPIEVVHEIISRLDALMPVESLYDCEIRAYCARYRHFKEDNIRLSAEELEYTSGCEGILWEKKCLAPSSWWYVVSLKDYLETRDPGFAGFNGHHEGADAA